MKEVKGLQGREDIIKPMHNSRISGVSNSTTKDHQVYMVHSVLSAPNTLSHSVYKCLSCWNDHKVCEHL